MFQDDVVPAKIHTEQQTKHTKYLFSRRANETQKVLVFMKSKRNT